jgi:hypothetical protein
LVSSNFSSSDILEQFVKISNGMRGSGGRQERFVLDVRIVRGALNAPNMTVLFSLQVYSPRGEFAQDIYVSAAPNDAEITGLRMGPK